MCFKMSVYARSGRLGQIVLSLKRWGLLRRTPGQARSLEVLVSPDDLPIL